MDGILLVARLLLAGVFGVAGLAKLTDRTGSRQAMIDFGVPGPLATPLGILLPLAELSITAALVPTITAWWGALGALTLLLLFVAAISVNLARGRSPDCHCFGQLHSVPAGWATLARNGLLAAVAGFVIWQGGDDAGLSVVTWLFELTAFQLATLVAGVVVLGLLAAEGWFLVHLLGQNGRLLIRVEALEARLAADGMTTAPTPTLSTITGLPVGSPAPSFHLASLSGEPMTLHSLRATGNSVMLVFSDPGCGPCHALLPDLVRWQRDYASALTIALISRGKPEANRAKIAEYGVQNVLLQQDREVAQSYQAYGTPTAVIVRPDGTIGSPPASGAAAIGALVDQAVKTRGQAGRPIPVHLPGTTANGSSRNGVVAASKPSMGLKIGQVAPALQLPDLTGSTVDLADFRGSKTLLLFWNPGCGFCIHMLNDVKAWEDKPSKGAPKLLIISTGTVEANQAMGLRSPIVLDHGFATGRAFGAGGTPSAVLIDADGNIASAVAVGAPAVLALAAGRETIQVG
jgi:peroxiredoxin